MRGKHQFSVTLTPDLAKLVRAKVASGEYACEGDVISEGLRALQAHELATDAWLRQEVLPAYDAIMADPSRGRSVAAVRATLDRAHKSTK